MGDKYSKIGALNPIFRSKFIKGTSHSDNFKMNNIDKVISLFYNWKEDVSPVGEMRGMVVLSVPMAPFDLNVFPFQKVSESIVSVHVRIPEVHGFIPNPLDFIESDPIMYENLARAYPLFSGYKKDSRVPKVGDIVLVDFFNPKEKSRGGSYKELLTTAEELSGFESFAGAIKDFMNGGVSSMGKQVTGDGIYEPGDGKNYEIVKGYNVNGDVSFMAKLDPFISRSPLSPENTKKLIFIISSRCSTMDTFVSTQDKLTIGYRRLAASGLDKLLQTHYGFGTDEAVANNYEKAIQISEDPKWIEIQFDDHMASLRSSLKRHNFKRGREIALWERIKNSAPAWLDSDPKTYEAMKRIYIGKKEEKGAQRIATIESYIGANEVWR